LGGSIFGDVGGGVFVWAGGLELLHCDVLDNTTGPDYGWGGGLCLESSGNVTIEDSRIEQNTSSAYGGGIAWVFTSGGVLRNNSISQNSASYHAGIALFGNEVLMEGNVFSANLSTWAASAVGIQGSQDIVFQANRVINNEGPGVLFGDECSFTMTNNIIAGNGGTGLSVWGGEDPWGNPLPIDGWMYHNTLAGNEAAGIRAGDTVNLRMFNTILASHTVAITTAYRNSGPVITADHTLWDGQGIYVDDSAGGTVVTTNDLQGDPAFVGQGDYHLTAASAAVDAGADVGVLVDIDGQPRPAGGGFDVGADELLPVLEINYEAGAPGSYFNLSGVDFTPNGTAMISANGVDLGTVVADASGRFTVTLSTDAADEGIYIAKATADASASIRFELDIDDPVRPQEGDWPVLAVPAGIALTNALFLPAVLR
jgi:parallel beta-helix repeat protein